MLIFITLAVLPMAFALPAMDVGNGTLSKQRVAVLTSNMATGTRNVRWETRPMNQVDANGKPIAAKSTGTKNADGTTVFGCLDAYSDANHKDGETYERPNGKFKYRCNSGIEEVVACVGSDRTNKALIPVGETLDVNGFWHKCQSFPNGSVVYTQATSCSHAGREYKVDDVVNVGYLRLQCQENGFKVVGCFYLDDNNKPVELNAGDQRLVGQVTHYCEQHGDTLQYFSKATGCKKGGKEYKEGEAYSENHLHYKCVNGIVDILGCYIDEKRDLALGKDLVENSTVHRCYRLGGQVEYTEYACGFNGTPSCTPEPIPQTPDDVPQLGHGLKAPGFGTFAVVQRVGGQNFAADPSTLKLELDKLLASHQ